MADRIVFRVLPDRGRWKVTRNSEFDASFDTKEPAVDYATERARTAYAEGSPSQVIIARADGTIEDERTYGEDPYPPRG
jgi:hypothetical protein